MKIIMMQKCEGSVAHELDFAVNCGAESFV
jgi:hypothetical protein